MRVMSVIPIESTTRCETISVQKVLITVMSDDGTLWTKTKLMSEYLHFTDMWCADGVPIPIENEVNDECSK